MEDAIWVKYQRDPCGPKREYRYPTLMCAECNHPIPRADHVIIQLTSEDSWQPVYCYECGSMKRMERLRKLRSLHRKARNEE